MADSTELLSLLVVVEFMMMAAVVALLIPLDAAIPSLPLASVFLVVLHLHRS